VEVLGHVLLAFDVDDEHIDPTIIGERQFFELRQKQLTGCAVLTSEFEEDQARIRGEFA
jgi:hypothetical protein